MCPFPRAAALRDKHRELKAGSREHCRRGQRTPWREHHGDLRAASPPYASGSGLGPDPVGGSNSGSRVPSHGGEHVRARVGALSATESASSACVGARSSPASRSTAPKKRAASAGACARSSRAPRSGAPTEIAASAGAGDGRQPQKRLRSSLGARAIALTFCTGPRAPGGGDGGGVAPGQGASDDGVVSADGGGGANAPGGGGAPEDRYSHTMRSLFPFGRGAPHEGGD